MALMAEDVDLRLQLDASNTGPRPLIPITGPGLLLGGGSSCGLILIGAIIGVTIDDGTALLIAVGAAAAFVAALAVVAGLAVQVDRRAEARTAGALAQGDAWHEARAAEAARTEATLEGVASELVTIHGSLASLMSTDRRSTVEWDQKLATLRDELTTDIGVALVEGLRADGKILTMKPRAGEQPR